MQDVIVVGAGPAGNNAAFSLASQGYGVTVIDFRENIGDKLCTGLVGEECFRRYPIDSALVHREINAASVIAPSGEVVRFETPRPAARVVNRVAYVSSFADRAREAGAEYLLGHRVMRLEQQKDRVTVTTDGGSVEGRASVLAAGFGSRLSRQLGLGEPADYVVGVQALVQTQGVDEVEVYLGREVAPGFFAWLVPTQPGYALAGLLVRKNASEWFARFIAARREDGKITELLILRDQSMCCYGAVPKINEWVSVRMPEGKGVKPVMDVPITIFGTLKVGEVLENGYLVGIYEMDGHRLGGPIDL